MKTVKKKVLIVEDHPMMTSGLEAYVNARDDLEVCCLADSCKSMLGLLSTCTPDFVILDLHLKQGSGLDTIKQICLQVPDCRILVYTMLDEEMMGERCLRAGADGFLCKQAPSGELDTAIDTILGGAPYLSPGMSQRILNQWRRQPGKDKTGRDRIGSLTDREIQVLQQMAFTTANRTLAQELGISVKTVERHQENMKDKLQLQSTFDLRSFAREWFSGRQPESADRPASVPRT